MLRDRRANMWLRNAKGDLPLHEAAASGRRELVQWLLDQRPKQVNTPSNDGRTILHIAAGNDYTDMCKVQYTINLAIRLRSNSPFKCPFKISTPYTQNRHSLIHVYGHVLVFISRC